MDMAKRLRFAIAICGARVLVSVLYLEFLYAQIRRRMYRSSFLRNFKLRKPAVVSYTSF